MRLSIFFWSLEGLFCVLAYVLHYFTKAKMGMARYVILRSNQLEKAFNVETIRDAVVIALVLMVAIQMFLYMKQKKPVKPLLKWQSILAMVLTSICLYLGLKYQFKTIRSYYFFMGPLVLAAALQNALTLIAHYKSLRRGNHV